MTQALDSGGGGLLSDSMSGGKRGYGGGLDAFGGDVKRPRHGGEEGSILPSLVG